MFLPVRKLNSAQKAKEGVIVSGEGIKRGFTEADSLMSQEG